MADLFSDVDITPRNDDRYVRRPRLGLPTVVLLGLVVPPVAWVLHQQISYAFATLWCDVPAGVMHGLTLVLFVTVVANGWRVYRFAGARIVPDEDHDGPDLGRFLALLAVVGAALSAAAILAQWIPNFLLSPCR